MTASAQGPVLATRTAGKLAIFLYANGEGGYVIVNREGAPAFGELSTLTRDQASSDILDAEVWPVVSDDGVREFGLSAEDPRIQADIEEAPY